MLERILERIRDKPETALGHPTLILSAKGGQRGELRRRYREGQEDQLGALGLVLNVITLWNTIYLEQALGQLRSEGQRIEPEDVARLSPLQHKHINFLGRYQFSLLEPVMRGEYRPLRSPEDSIFEQIP